MIHVRPMIVFSLVVSLCAPNFAAGALWTGKSNRKTRTSKEAHIGFAVLKWERAVKQLMDKTTNPDPAALKAAIHSLENIKNLHYRPLVDLMKDPERVLRYRVKVQERLAGRSVRDAWTVLNVMSDLLQEEKIMNKRQPDGTRVFFKMMEINQFWFSTCVGALKFQLIPDTTPVFRSARNDRAGGVGKNQSSSNWGIGYEGKDVAVSYAGAGHVLLTTTFGGLRQHGPILRDNAINGLSAKLVHTDPTSKVAAKIVHNE